MTPVYSTTLGLLAGALLALGLVHLFVVARRRAEMEQLSLGLLCLSGSAMVLLTIAGAYVETVEAYRANGISYILLGLAQYPLGLWFVSSFSRVRARALLGGTVLVCVGLAAVTLISSGEAFFTVHSIEAGAPTVSATRWFLVFWALELLVPCFSVYAIVRMFRAGLRRDATILAALIVVFVLAFFGEILNLGPFEAVPLLKVALLVTAVVMSFRLTDRVVEASRIKESLIESERELRLTLDSIHEGVVTLDAEGRVTRVNAKGVEILGRGSDEVLGQPLSAALPLVDRTTRASIDLTDLGRPPYDLEGAPVLVLRDGTERRIASTSVRIQGSDRTLGRVVSFRDVTEQLLLEKKVRHSQKLEALGQLTGGIAHDFNNLLTAILGYGELLSMQLGAQTEMHRNVKVILEMGHRAVELTRNLLVFSHDTPSRKTHIEVHGLITQVAQILRTTCDPRIGIHESLTASSDRTLGDGALIQGAIMNLGLNARDSMPDGGTLVFETRNVRLDEQHCHASDFDIDTGEYLEIAVVDTGEGIPASVRPFIFDPFFTTKQVGKGTGLGLAAVHGTVRDHSGSIEVESTPGKTVFRLHLPLHEARESAETNETGELPHGEGCVLVVDDEPAIRNLTRRMLEGIGYSVLEAADGAQALSVLRRNKGRISAVVLDMILPKLRGDEVLRRLRLEHPEMPVLVATGFADSEALERVQKWGAVELLTKPYTREELARKLTNLAPVA